MTGLLGVKQWQRILVFWHISKQSWEARYYKTNKQCLWSNRLGHWDCLPGRRQFSLWGQGQPACRRSTQSETWTFYHVDHLAKWMMWDKVIPSRWMRGAKVLRQRRDYAFQSVRSSPGFSHVSFTRSWVPSAEGLRPPQCEGLSPQLALWGGGGGGRRIMIGAKEGKGGWLDTK